MKLKITVNDKLYEVDVEASEPETTHKEYRGYPIDPSAVRMPAAPPVAAAPPPVNGGGPPVNEDKVCRSPISGIVVRVTAKIGQQIQPGDTILVLEAMKMETNITAPIAGKIVKINAKQGESVQSGTVLAEFE